MRMRTALVLILAASSGDASAQPVPYGERGAQLPSGITVTGRGTAAATPTRAKIVVTINSQSNASVSVEDAENALVDALHASGVADAHTVFPVGNVSAAFAPLAVVGNIVKPTREKLEAMARGVVKALPERFAPILSKAQIQLALSSDDCSADEARAERAAFEDARERARRIAADANVRLGAVLAVVAAPGLTFGCAAKPDALETNVNGPFGFGGLYAPLVLPINASLTVTYALR